MHSDIFLRKPVTGSHTFPANNPCVLKVNPGEYGIKGKVLEMVRFWNDNVYRIYK
ncbi:MAG: hypothetical protein WDO71_17930 [Bacteroidota bacterium]